MKAMYRTESEITDLIKCWKINYGLDKRSPENAMRWWSDKCNSMAPAGAVAALGIMIEWFEGCARHRGANNGP